MEESALRLFMISAPFLGISGVGVLAVYVQLMSRRRAGAISPEASLSDFALMMGFATVGMIGLTFTVLGMIVGSGEPTWILAVPIGLTVAAAILTWYLFKRLRKMRQSTKP